MVILTPLMTEKNDDSSEIAEVELEEKKNFKDVIPERLSILLLGLQLFWLFSTYSC